MREWLAAIPPIDLVLGAGLAVAGLAAAALRPRGGRFRGLPGWVLFWVLFAGIVVALSRANRWVAFAALAVLMFVALRTYFFVAPLRPRDYLAILAAYGGILAALLPGFLGSPDAFLATVPIILFLLLPALLSLRREQRGFLDAVGRVMLGVLLFVFCPAHLGLLTSRPAGVLELFALLALAADLPQRLFGRRAGNGWARPAGGFAMSLALAAALGFATGPWCGVSQEDAARAGLLVALAVAAGGLISEAVARDLELSAVAPRTGRGAFLDRTVPAVCAAPVFFHYLNHFAP